MENQRRRALGYLALVLGVIVAYTLLYSWAMGTLEGEPRSFLRSLVVVVETFTTVGYGEDAPWSSPWLNILVVNMMISGLALVILALPLFVGPWLETRMAVSLPSSSNLTDHVVICGYTPRTQTLAEELTARDVPYLFLISDDEMGETLYEEDEPLVVGDPESTEALEAAGVGEALAVVLDEGDEVNATAALSVREVAEDRRVVALLEDPDRADSLRYAGVDTVLSPRELLGRGLANKVTSSVTSKVGDTVTIGEDFEIVELPVQGDSPLEGVPLRHSGVRERTGANVIGAWLNGEFVPTPPPDEQIQRSTVLLVAGTGEQLEELKELTLSRRRGHEHEVVLVGGFGEVGETVRDIVDEAELQTTVIDRLEKPGVDLVGEVDDIETLVDAGIDEASGLVLALPDDVVTIFTVLIARQRNPDLEIVCRANEAESSSKLYRAGADYVLALDAVAGRMLAGAVFDEEVLGLDTSIEIVRTEAPRLVGSTLAEADVRARTNCTVIAVERDGEIHTDIGPDFTIHREDALIVAGTDESIATFYEFVDASFPATDD